MGSEGIEKHQPVEEKSRKIKILAKGGLNKTTFRQTMEKWLTEFPNGYKNEEYESRETAAYVRR